MRKNKKNVNNFIDYIMNGKNCQALFPLFPFPVLGYKKNANTDTISMRIPLLKNCICLLFVGVCFSSCQTHAFSGEVSSPVSITESASVVETDEDVWDVSSVNVSKIDRNRKLISFTFDDAPSRHLQDLLDVFASYNALNPDCPASATLFCNSNRFDNDSVSTLKKACALGFELGNHTHSHFDLTTLSEKELKTEIDKTDRILKKIDGRERHLLRAPFGKADEFVKTFAPAPLIDWTIDTLDWTGIEEENIFTQVYSNLADGNIVLMHDGYEHTVSALKRLLPALKETGYQVVGVSELAKSHNCVLRRGNVYIRARRVR